MQLLNFLKVSALSIVLILIYVSCQLSTILNVKYFGVFYAPFALLVVTMMAPLWLLYLSDKSIAKSSNQANSVNHKYYKKPIFRILLLAVASISVFYHIAPIDLAFDTNPLPTKNSDVIQQLEHLFDGFVRGKQPYTSVSTMEWPPFPVYMPMHWLPIGIGRGLEIDVRWGGYILFVLIYIIAVSLIAFKKNISFGHILFFAVFPFLFFKVPLSFRPEDINSVFELVVAGYYLLLGLGLYLKSDKTIIIALICIMLSRYTIVFFVPLIILTLYFHYGWKKPWQYIRWGGLAFLLLYVIPFLMRDPTIFSQGLDYHNTFAKSQYSIVASGKLPHIMNEGSSFMLIAYEWWRIEDSDLAMRCIRLFQILISLIGFGLLFLFYRKRKSKIDVYDFLLASAAIFCVLFYCTAPFGYGYYWMGYLTLIWIVILRIWEKQSQIIMRHQ